MERDASSCLLLVLDTFVQFWLVFLGVFHQDIQQVWKMTEAGLAGVAQSRDDSAEVLLVEEQLFDDLFSFVDVFAVLDGVSQDVHHSQVQFELSRVAGGFQDIVEYFVKVDKSDWFFVRDDCFGVFSNVEQRNGDGGDRLAVAVGQEAVHVLLLFDIHSGNHFVRFLGQQIGQHLLEVALSDRSYQPECSSTEVRP